MSTIKTNQLAHTANGASVFTLPQTDGSANQLLKTDGSGNLAFTSAITEVDQWYLTADVTSTQTITSDLTRNVGQSGTGAAPIGTGMTESSGVFSFPTTGKYMIIVHARFSIASSDSCNIATQLSVDGGSNWITSAYASDGNNGSGNRDGASTSLFFFDVTDVSQRKVRFNVGSIQSGSLVRGSDPILQTSFTFIRLGDT